MSIIINCISCGKEFETDDWFGYCEFCGQPYGWDSHEGTDDLVKDLIKDL
jgi:rRNA maturation endonuclease Nob1